MISRAFELGLSYRSLAGDLALKSFALHYREVLLTIKVSPEFSKIMIFEGFEELIIIQLN